jgi:hypothetical protein
MNKADEFIFPKIELFGYNIDYNSYVTLNRERYVDYSVPIYNPWAVWTGALRCVGTAAFRLPPHIYMEMRCETETVDMRTLIYKQYQIISDSAKRTWSYQVDIMPNGCLLHVNLLALLAPLEDSNIRILEKARGHDSLPLLLKRILPH